MCCNDVFLSRCDKKVEIRALVSQTSKHRLLPPVDIDLLSTTSLETASILEKIQQPQKAIPRDNLISWDNKSLLM